MTPYAWLIVALWIVFVVYWLVSAMRTKRSVGRRPWGWEAVLRVLVIALILIALQVPAVRQAARDEEAWAAARALMGLAGAVLCVLGFGLAFWARVHIGRNWGRPMSRKADPELVTSGPYAFVRHPIYAGMILAMLGSSLAMSLFWALPLAAFGGYFVYSARREERIMTELFPEQYPAYRTRTKMLVPFVL